MHASELPEGKFWLRVACAISDGCYAVSDISEKIGSHSRTVSRRIDELQDLGWVDGCIPDDYGQMTQGYTLSEDAPDYILDAAEEVGFEQ